MQEYVKWLSDKPHPVGETRDIEIARWIRTKFEDMKLDHVKEYSYEVLLSFPTGENKVFMLIFLKLRRLFETQPYLCCCHFPKYVICLFKKLIICQNQLFLLRFENSITQFINST